MRKSTYASIASICMLPALFWSQESSAIPNWARKYGTSCYTCHSGFPTRNAFGEAFKANGFRWPSGEDADHSKQEQVKLGADGWKNTFPDSPWPSDLPGYAPVAIFVTGPLVNYADKVQKSTGAQAGQQVTPQLLNWGGPFDARILYGGTIGENVGFFGAIQGIAAGATTSSFRATWSFSPGVMLGVGNSFNFFSSGEDISTYSRVFPTTNGTGLEFTYVAGEKSGGVNIYAGVVGKGTTAAALSSTATPTHLDDIRYIRAEYKIGGAGVLSGAGGTLGNGYLGMDNHLGIGVGIVDSKPSMINTLTTESRVYGVDASGNYGSFTGGVAYGKGKDLKLSNYAVDAGYFVYPWLKANLAYTNLGVVGVNTNNPTYTTTVTAWPKANISIAAAYKIFSKNIDPATTNTTGNNNANTFTLTAGLGF